MATIARGPEICINNTLGGRPNPWDLPPQDVCIWDVAKSRDVQIRGTNPNWVKAQILRFLDRRKQFPGLEPAPESGMTGTVLRDYYWCVKDVLGYPGYNPRTYGRQSLNAPQRLP